MFKKKTKEFTLVFNREICNGCGKCMHSCNRNVIRLHWTDDKAKAWAAYPENCRGCGRCLRKCPVKAIHVTEDRGSVMTDLLFGTFNNI